MTRSIRFGVIASVIILAGVAGLTFAWIASGNGLQGRLQGMPHPGEAG